MVREVEPKPVKLAKASFFDGSMSLYGNPGTFYMPGIVDQTNQALGLTPQKLIIPREYHQVVQMCYDFYQRGGMASVVVNRLSELSITKIRNGQRKTSDEANEYYDSVLHRRPSRLFRFINSIALEYFLSGLVLPKVDWVPMSGADISPDLTARKEYWMPTFDWYPPLLVNIVWVGWGNKGYYLKVPGDVLRLIKAGGSRIKEQQLKYEIYKTYYPEFVEQVKNGADIIPITDVDPILRKEVSYSPYPTPFMFSVLEALVFRQQLRRMDYAVATRVINAILLVQSGNDMYPTTEDSDTLEELKKQINARANNPMLLERVFELFADHTVKLTWVSPDVQAMLNQEKYRQVNEELQEGLGFSRLLITGESRNAQASELSTYSIQPMMEELRNMLQEWMVTIYEEAAKRNKFRNIPVPNFTPIKLQDVVKTAAIFAQAFKEGNISRTTRDEQLGLDFETELELMGDEKDLMGTLPKKFPDMPYNVQVVPGSMGGGLFGRPPLTNGSGRPVNAPNKGGRPLGSQNVPVNNRRSGVKPPGQKPASQLKQSAEIEEDVELLSDEELLNLIDRVAQQRGIYITMADLGFEEDNENNSSQN